MKKFISGFFSSPDGEASSKRLVGVIGALALFYTLFDNSKSESTYIPADSLVWATFALAAVALGLTTIESVTSLIRGYKGKDENETK
jgi:hypothetical protein